jgi:peptidyl-prolyl cis-trans isomerase A (cyclophilin A)
MGPRSRDFNRWAYSSSVAGVSRLCAAAAALLGLLFATPSVLGGTLVQMNYANFGSVQIDLFDDLVPTTVNNFLQNYVATGKYTNSMVHRVDTGLGVIQGGGFQADSNAIATNAPIPLQYSRANTRGTLAMARSNDGGNVANTGTATGQWFINTDNNSSSLGPAPGNGTTIPDVFGYAVFGWVVGPGMSVVDAIAAVPTINYTGVPQPWADSWGLKNQSALGQWPLQNFTLAEAQAGANPLPHVVVLSSLTVVKTHPSFQNPFLATDINNDGSLKASDVATVNLDLLKNGFHDLTGPFSGTSYLDVDGNGRVNLSDSLKTINALLKSASPQASPLSEPSVSPLLVVPEPSSLVLGGLAALALAGYAARARRERRSTSGKCRLS